jgi:hypothetical protein
MLFLTMVEAQRRVIVLTEQDMCDQCEKEAAGGRVPPANRIRLRSDPGRAQNRFGCGEIEGIRRRFRKGRKTAPWREADLNIANGRFAGEAISADAD